MIARPAPHTSPEVFRALARDAGLPDDDALTPDPAWRLFTTTFAATPFSATSGPDSDGMLYQYGVYAFGGDPHFRFDFTRQFSLPGSGEYLQFHCTFGYLPDDGLRALGDHHEWWFPGHGPDLQTWARSVRQRPEWTVVTAARPLWVEIGCDET